MLFVKGKFIANAIVQCDHHYETDEKFHFIKTDKTGSALENYTTRITHWLLIREPTKE